MARENKAEIYQQFSEETPGQTLEVAHMDSAMFYIAGDGF